MPANIYIEKIITDIINFISAVFEKCLNIEMIYTTKSENQRLASTYRILLSIYLIHRSLREIYRLSKSYTNTLKYTIPIRSGMDINKKNIMTYIKHHIFGRSEYDEDCFGGGEIYIV